MSTLLPGSTLQNGKYEIQRVLGQDSFGVTYLALQQGLNRIVAIKEFFMENFCVRNADTHHVTIATEGSREFVEHYRNKFLQVARNIAKLEHPNIVSMIDVFEENNTAYYVMRYAQNGSLDDKVKREGHLSEPEATRYILKIAKALRFVHEHKMTHLDVKPANILLSEKDEPWLVDFGLSKQYDYAGKATSFTPLGYSNGYAPIEQYMPGGADTFSPESDIYSLGATFFKLLTGITPPDASTIANEGLPVHELKAKGVSQQTIYLIFQAMEPLRKDRLRDMGRFIKLLMEITTSVNSRKEYRAGVEKDGKSGFIDKNGTIVVPCIYDYAGWYSEGMVRVNKDGKSGFIDKNGTLVVPCIYDDAFNEYSEGMAAVKKDGKWGFIDKNGTLIVPCIYDYAAFYSEGMADVWKDGKGGFIDKNGTLVVPCIYNDASFYNEGMAAVEKDGKWGFIDKNGTLIVPCIYDNAKFYSEGMAVVEKDGKWGYVDKNGTLVVPCIYDGAEDYREGIAAVKKDGKRGFVDKNGTLVVPCIYDGAEDYREGMAAVKKNGKWGFIDKHGTLIVPCIYDNAMWYSEGMAAVKKDGKWGFIDKNGTLVVPCIYDDAELYFEGMARVKMNNKWGFIDKNGTIVVPCIYDDVKYYSECTAAVKKYGKWGFIDKNGTLVVPCIYDDAEYFEAV